MSVFNFALELLAKAHATGLTATFDYDTIKNNAAPNSRQPERDWHKLFHARWYDSPIVQTFHQGTGLILWIKVINGDCANPSYEVSLIPQQQPTNTNIRGLLANDVHQLNFLKDFGVEDKNDDNESDTDNDDSKEKKNDSDDVIHASQWRDGMLTSQENDPPTSKKSIDHWRSSERNQPFVKPILRNQSHHISSVLGRGR
jgi:hypothetical protein